MLSTSTFSVLTLCSLAAGHFNLHYPPTLGFSDDNEGTAPCGGFDVIFNTTTNISADSFPVETTTFHPQGQWLMRATLDQKAPFNWTNLLPVINEIGLGDFCLPNLKVPAEFVGKTGLVQIIQDAADGKLYQCSAVNFVAGSNSTYGSNCKNATGVTASLTNLQDFGNASTTSTAAPNTTASSTSSVPAATTSSIAAGRLEMGAIGGSLAGFGLFFGSILAF